MEKGKLDLQMRTKEMSEVYVRDEFLEAPYLVWLCGGQCIGWQVEEEGHDLFAYVGCANYYLFLG